MGQAAFSACANDVLKQQNVIVLFTNTPMINVQYLAMHKLNYKCVLIGVGPITQYTHVCNKNSNTQGSSPNVVEVIFQTFKELLLKERIRSLWERILSFKRSSHLREVLISKRGRNCTESLLDTVVSP